MPADLHALGPGMALIPTQPAPQLSLPLTGGGSTDDLTLGTGTDGRFTLVVFFRGLHCPICRKQLAEIEKNLDSLADSGVGRVLAVSMETAERSEQLTLDWHLTRLPVAHGLTEQAARDWGLFISRAISDGEPATFSEPGMVVLDADGTVFWSSIASMPFGRPALDDVLAGLRYAQEKDYPARGAA